jgi:hypothetical protein
VLPLDIADYEVNKFLKVQHELDDWKFLACTLQFTILRNKHIVVEICTSSLVIGTTCVILNWLTCLVEVF